jgi:hypothetical protein
MLFGSLNAFAANLAEALNTPFVKWYSGGNTNPTYWSAEANDFQADGLAAVSGAITNDQSCWMQTTVHGVTNVTVWWKVSSEKDMDMLRFYINDFGQFKNVLEVSGTNDGWQFVSCAITNSGTNTLRWSYEKDVSLSEGEDCGWVDEITFNPSFAPTAPIELGTPMVTNGQAQFTLSYEAGWLVNVLYSTNLASGIWTRLLSTNTTASTTVILDAGATNSTGRRFYRALAPLYLDTIYQQ